MKQLKELLKILQESADNINGIIDDPTIKVIVTHHFIGDEKDDDSKVFVFLGNYDVFSLTYFITIRELKKIKDFSDVWLSLHIPIDTTNIQALDLANIISSSLVQVWWETGKVYYYDKDKKKIYADEQAQDAYEGLMLKKYNASKCPVCDNPRINEFMGKDGICIYCEEFLKENKKWH